MSIIPDLIYDGVLEADGTIHLDHPPDLRPGPVRVTVRPTARDFMLPDPPWPDESIPAPCDLPLPGPFESVELIEVHDVLPDPPWPDESISAPCDLPLLGPREPVTFREVDVWLPDPHDVE